MASVQRAWSSGTFCQPATSICADVSWNFTSVGVMLRGQPAFTTLKCHVKPITLLEPPKMSGGWMTGGERHKRQRRHERKCPAARTPAAYRRRPAVAVAAAAADESVSVLR